MDGLVTISSQNAAGDAAWDTDLYVYDSCGGLVVASNDDCCGYYGPSTVEFASVSGVDYKILWQDSWGPGPFTWTLEEEAGSVSMPDLEVTSISVTDGIGTAQVTNIGDADAVGYFGDGGTIEWYVNDEYFGYEYPDPYPAGGALSLIHI